MLGAWETPAIAALAIALVVMLILWIPYIGIVRAGLATVCRALWMLPILLALFPITILENLPRSVALKPIHILIDDSESMEPFTVGGDSESLRASLDEECLKLGCLPKFYNLSDLDDRVASGFTPLSDVLSSWYLRIGKDPWVIVSDGGDFKPSLAWPRELRGMGRAPKEGAEPNGMILGVVPEDHANLWVEVIDVPPFSFESKPFQVRVVLRRSPSLIEESSLVQLQVKVNDKTLATTNAPFRSGDESVDVAIPIPALPRGKHLLEITALPLPAEKTLWDNRAFGTVEVMPNTIGALHLLGSPSWDGRFLRRYLKSEPKYDLISFFILRDRWDSQVVSERELSLIPFPVDRLFNEELPNFRVVVIQNFALFEFLQPEYQRNLVEFVKNGGGLLFMGGPRALQDGDLTSSALGSILPFKTKHDAKSAPSNRFPFLRPVLGQSENRDGPYYDENLEFSIKFANPDKDERGLATVFDDWRSMERDLTELGTLQGLHHMENVLFKKGDHTPLLEAEVPGTGKLPLAVASYPGKGRAIWLFSDNLWRLSMSANGAVSSSSYHRFFQAAMNWLLRQEFRRPLILSQFELRKPSPAEVEWEVLLQGPAAEYFASSGKWQVKVCGVPVDRSTLSFLQSASSAYLLKGTLNLALAGGQRCELSIEGEHKAFGSVSSSVNAILPSVFSDRQIPAAENKLQQLAALTGAKLSLGSAEDRPIQTWLEGVTGTAGIALPGKYRSIQEHYWMLDRWWVWLLFLCLPLEVLIRRWHKIFARQTGRPTFASRRGAS